LLEEGLTLPSTIIQRNKLWIKSIRKTDNINDPILKFSDANFLHKDVIAIEMEWNCSTQEMINTYKGQKLLSKRQIKQALAAQKDKLVENCLKTTNWNWTDWGCPAKLPIQESKPHPILTKARGP
jgi:hypothetical protein